MTYGLFIKDDNKLLQFPTLNQLYQFIIETQLDACFYKIYKLEEIL